MDKGIRTLASRAQSGALTNCAIPTMSKFLWVSAKLLTMCSKGFEPPTHGLEGRCSIQLSYEHTTVMRTFHNKAGDGNRTTYPAWKAGVLPLNYTAYNRVTGFEPATSWSQTRRSSQAEPHPYFSVASLLSYRDARIIIWQSAHFVNNFLKLFQKLF